MRRVKAILVLLAAVAFALSPLWTPEFNGFNPELFPHPQYDPPVQPAGYAFSIWGPIYLWLILHGGVGLLRRAGNPSWDAMRWPLFVSLAVGTGWLAVATVNAVVATLQIWVMLIAALFALARSPDGIRPPDAGPAKGAGSDRWLAQAPVAVYAGWLTAASCVSLGLLLAGYGLMEERAAAVVCLCIAVALAATVQLKLSRAPEYGLAVIWALIGIIVSNWGDGWLVPALSVAGILILAVTALRVART